MRPVSDGFLPNIAQVSAALVGLFFVGMFFFVETGFRCSTARWAIEPYFRAATAIVLVCYTVPSGLSLSLVALEINSSRVLFALMSLELVAIRSRR